MIYGSETGASHKPDCGVNLVQVAVEHPSSRLRRRSIEDYVRSDVNWYSGDRVLAGDASGDLAEVPGASYKLHIISISVIVFRADRRVGAGTSQGYNLHWAAIPACFKAYL